MTMATVKELKATARPSVGKGAARAERRAGRVPGVIYGNNQPPTPISVDDIPQYIDADVSGLEIGHSLHLSDIKLPSGVKSLAREDITLVTIVPPSGYAEEQKAAAAAAAAAATGVPAPGAAPAAGATAA